MRPGFYEFGPEGSDNIIWVVGAEVINGRYGVQSDDDWQTCYPTGLPTVKARRVGDAAGARGDYNSVINAFRTTRINKESK